MARDSPQGVGDMARIDNEEIEVMCRQCNGYLWSIGPAEALVASETYGPAYDASLADCPMKKDPLGKCTGKLRSTP